jgi:hypothetical protein
LEGFALGLKGLDGFQEGGAVGDFLAVVGIGRWGGSEGGLVAAQPGGEAGGEAVELAPGGVDDAGCARNFVAAVLDKSINVIVFHHVAEVVFLAPSAEHAPGDGGAGEAHGDGAAAGTGDLGLGEFGFGPGVSVTFFR